MPKRRLVPFSMWPANWGLSGKRKEREKAEYYLTGEELDREIAKIDFDNKELSKKNLDIDLKYQKISEYEYAKQLVNLEYSENKEELDHRLLRVEFEHHKINEQEYEKRIAELLNEPYIGVKSSHFDIETGRFGIEYDWNDQFIKVLVENGYSGVTDSDIVQRWFNGQNLDNQSETINEPPVSVSTRTKKTINPESNKTEYS